MMYEMDEIVEDRVWRSGVEIVSRVNWTHVAKVRRSLGVVDGASGRDPLAIMALRAHSEAATHALTLETGRNRRIGRVSTPALRSA